MIRARSARRRLVLLLVLLVSVPVPAAALPRWPLPLGRLPTPPPPPVSAPAWIVFDDTFGVTLAAANPDERRPMASTTKIMTALVALDAEDREIVVSERAASAGEAEIGLVAGERLTLAELLPGLLVRSANDAAIAVAEGVAGSVEAFVARMNERADELGLENTHFANPHGLDAPGHYSSPADLLTLARTAMRDPRFVRIVRSTEAAFPPAPDGAPRSARTTNHLLEDYPGAIGVKTGFTAGAGLVLVGAAERDGRRIYAVVMGSEGERGHIRDVSLLLDYAFARTRIVPTAVLGPGLGDGDRSLDAEAATRAALDLAAVGLGPGGGPGAVEPPDPGDLARLPEPADAVRWWWR